MDDATREDMTKIKEAVLRELNDVEAIYLFGSVAKGTENKASDYDIFVVAKKSPKNKIDSIIEIRNNVSDNIRRPLELFILEVDDLKFPSPFLYEVYHNHRLIYGNDIIKKCEEIVKKIKPLFLNGVKIGYHV